MKHLLAAAALFLGLSAAPAMAQDDAAVVAHMKQLAHDWGDATVTGDADKLGRILADDWSSFGSSGVPLGKAAMLASLKAGKHKLTAFEIGPVDVKVLGDVAVVQGVVTEQRTDDGKDTSGRYIWMDVFVKRAGQWVCVRSTGFKAR